MSEALRVFIGWDSREPLAFAVCAHSILRRASKPVTIIPMVRGHYEGIYTRDPNGTTEFSLTRFLVPYLSGYEGISVFMDCDMLVLADIHDLVHEATKLNQFGGPRAFDSCAVSVVKHDYQPKMEAKATGQQTAYPKKNWSSVMVFNNERCKALTPLFVNCAEPAALHRFAWAESVGDLSLEWNWLVGEYEPNPGAWILHYTLGAPCYQQYANCDHADLWWAEYRHMNAPHEVLIPEAPYAVARAADYPVPPLMNIYDTPESREALRQLMEKA